MKAQWELEDVNTDQQDHGLQSFVTVDRDKAAGLGLTNAAIDNTLYDAFGQRHVSTIYKDVNQYHVVMEVAPQYGQDPTVAEQHLRLVRPRRADAEPARPPPRPDADRRRRAGRQRDAADHRAWPDAAAAWSARRAGQRRPR